jgi:hypothetical protein
MKDVLHSVSSNSRWFSKYGEELKKRVGYFDWDALSGPLAKKTQFFRILHDKKLNMAQGAFCINHWVVPLKDGYSEHNPRHGYRAGRLQQLVVYWQCHWSGDKTKHRVEANSKTDATVGDGDPIEPLTRAATAAASTSSTHTKASKGAPASINNDVREPLNRSNLIVVFERSELNIHHGRSLVLDSLSELVSSSDFFVETNKGSYTGQSKERLTGLNVLHLLRVVIENICDSLTIDLNEMVDSYIVRHARLAEEVFQKPEDDTLASKLWEYSREFQNAGKMINLLTLLVDDIRTEFARHLDDEALGMSFMAHLPSEFRNLATDVREELQKPITEMIDLVYKSMSIKDTRLSLELNSSLWRLSWVTFIFLPLTFLVGFFGMNVDTFSDDPSIKWYVPLKYVVGLWFGILKSTGTSLLRSHS